MKTGVAGFIAQLKADAKYNENFQSLFSIYLSNDEQVKGNIMFGGYDLAKYAKQGSTDKDIFWLDQSRNEQYWAVNNKDVSLGETKLVDDY